VEAGVSKVAGNDASGAFCVSPAITVCAADVLMRAVSGVATPGNAQAIAASSGIKTDNTSRSDIDMLHPLVFQSAHRDLFPENFQS
jgi:hypothetical protein